MNKEQMALILNGRDYRNEITKEEEKIAKENGLLICFGASDDLLELRGIINDELGAWDGGTAIIVKKKGGVIDVIDEDGLNELVEELNDFDIKIPTVKIAAEWCPEYPECSWLIKTEMKHATFDIMEDGELYCRGIVVEKSEIEKHLSNQ